MLPLNQPITYLDRSNVWFNISIKGTASPESTSHPGLAPNHIPLDKKCTSATLRPSHIRPSAVWGFGGFITVAVNMDRGGKHSTFLKDLAQGRDHQRCKDALWTAMGYPHKEIHHENCYWGDVLYPGLYPHISLENTFLTSPAVHSQMILP